MGCLSHVAAMATEAAASEAAEASTTAARRIAERPTHANESSARPLAWLVQDEESCGSGGEALGGRGLGQMTRTHSLPKKGRPKERAAQGFGKCR